MVNWKFWQWPRAISELRRQITELSVQAKTQSEREWKHYQEMGLRLLEATNQTEHKFNQVHNTRSDAHVRVAAMEHRWDRLEAALWEAEKAIDRGNQPDVVFKEFRKRFMRDAEIYLNEYEDLLRKSKQPV